MSKTALFFEITNHFHKQKFSVCESIEFSCAEIICVAFIIKNKTKYTGTKCKSKPSFVTLMILIYAKFARFPWSSSLIMKFRLAQVSLSQAVDKKSLRPK